MSVAVIVELAACPEMFLPASDAASIALLARFALLALLLAAPLLLAWPYDAGIAAGGRPP